MAFSCCEGWWRRLPLQVGRPEVFLSDGRVGAVLLFSPQGTHQMGLHEHSWDRMRTPVMSMTGTYDRGAGGQEPSWRMQPFTFGPPGDKYHVFIEGAHHFSFGGRLWSRPDQKAIFDCVKIASTAFWDAYLKDDAEARQYLRSDALATFGEKRITLHRK